MAFQALQTETQNVTIIKLISVSKSLDLYVLYISLVFKQCAWIVYALYTDVTIEFIHYD